MYVSTLNNSHPPTHLKLQETTLEMEPVHPLYLLSKEDYEKIVKTNAQPDEFGFIETEIQ